MGLFDRFRKKESTQEETYTPTLDEEGRQAGGYIQRERRDRPSGHAYRGRCEERG